MARNRNHYEDASEEYPAEAYTVRGWGQGIAFYVLGWETKPDEDTEWSGMENRTGRLLMVMVGDDARHSVDPDDVTALDEDAYCHECGQVGCTHDGRERE